MTKQFFTYTDKFVNFSPADKDRLKSALTFKSVAAKTALVSYDKRTDELFFLLKGCIRKYYSKDGEQMTVYIMRSEEHTSELQSRENLVCRLLLEKKKK